jgi:hypothetical protein
MRYDDVDEEACIYGTKGGNQGMDDREVSTIRSSLEIYTFLYT